MKIAGELQAEYAFFGMEDPAKGKSKSNMNFSKSREKSTVKIVGVFKGHDKATIISVRTPEESAQAHRNFARVSKEGTGLAFVLRPYTVLPDYQVSLRKYQLTKSLKGQALIK